MAGGDSKKSVEDGIPNGNAAIGTPFEEAVSLTGHGRFHFKLLVVCGLCLVSLIFESLAASYVTPAAQCDFVMSSVEKGVLNGAIYVGMIVSSHMWGYIADTRGRHRVLFITLSLDFVCSVVAAFMPNLPLLITMRFLNGIWICGPSAVTYAYLGEFHTEKTRTKHMVYVCVFLALGTLVQPALAWGVIPQPWDVELPGITLRSWRVFIILGAVPSAVTALALRLLLVESPKFLYTAGRHDEALQVLRTVYATNTGLPPEEYPVSRLQMDPASSPSGVNPKSALAVASHMWRQTAPLFRPPYVSTALIACVIQFGLYASSNGFLLWLPDLLNRMAEYSSQFPGQSASVCDVMAVLTGQAPPPVVGNYSSTDAAAKTLNHWMDDMDPFVPGYGNWSDVLASITANITSPPATDHTDSAEPLVRGFGNWSDTVMASPLVSTSMPTELTSCSSHIDPSSFQNTLITGAATAVAFISISFFVKFVGKKIILAVCLVASGACGIGTMWAQTELQILLLPMAFIALSGMCIAVVNSIVVDAFPTSLRAMAVCLSLCCGRLGTFVTTLMLGALVESNCSAAIGILGGFVLLCGVLSTLLPSEKQLRDMKH